MRIRRMSSAKRRAIISAWFRRMAGWTVGEVARQLAYPGPLVGSYDPRLSW